MSISQKNYKYLKNVKYLKTLNDVTPSRNKSIYLTMLTVTHQVVDTQSCVLSIKILPFHRDLNLAASFLLFEKCRFTIRTFKQIKYLQGNKFKNEHDGC